MRSHSPFGHAEQAAPPEPQSAADCIDDGMQVLPLQQPIAHDVASQTHWPVALLHSWPVEQGEHAAPPVPQDEPDSDV